MYIFNTSFSLSARLLAALALVALLSVGGVGLADYLSQRTAMETQVKAQLISIADLKKEQIVIWLQEREADARLLAVNKLNQDHFSRILSPYTSLEYKAVLAAFLSDNLIGLKESRSGYSDIAFVDQDGWVLVSTRPEQVGQSVLHTTAFAQTLASAQGKFVQDIHRDPNSGLTKMTFGHVMQAIDLKTGEEKSDVNGVVLITVNMDETIYPLIGAWPGMGETGETLLVRAEGETTLFLNNLRFDDQAALSLRIGADSVSARPAHYASRGQEGIIQTADYRGIPVLAAYRHIPDVNWGFVAKEDLAEAYGPIDALTRRIGWIALMVLVVAVVVSLAISRTLTRPLDKLVQVTQAVAAGNLNSKIDITRNDEIGALADSFRSMVASLKVRQHQVKVANAATEESAERLKRIYEAAQDAIFLIDPASNTIIEANPRASNMLGYSQQELAGMPISQIHPHDMGPLAKLWDIILQDGVGQSDELTCSTCQDESIPVEITFSLVQIRERQYVLAMARDIAKRRQLEEQLRQAQKMEAIGQLAGGVAHDFNNLLTIITGYSELLQYRITDETLKADIEQIHKAGERAAALTRQLLAFSRKQVLQPTILNINKIVIDTEKMLQRLIGENIELVTSLESLLGQVKADVGQIEQVIVNLVVNARDAMPDGGKLTLETANVDLSGIYTQRYLGLKAGHYIMLAVSDTGIGMDAKTQTRIFEPFFTTKGVDKGTGLGLATVYGIVTQSEGTIRVYSEPGQGTTFKIYLPQIEIGALPGVENGSSAEALPYGFETVLLVEDESGVRKLAREILQQSGYSVLEADNGQQALKISQEYDRPIHLLLTDVIMPHMSGHELVENLSPIHPETKVVYMSGYTDKAIIQHDGLDPGVNFLQKPFSADMLARKLRKVLDN